MAARNPAAQYRVRVRNSAEFEAQHARFMSALADLRRSAEAGDAHGVVNHYASVAFVQAHKLVPLLVHDKQVPKDKVKVFEKTVREFQRRRLPRNLLDWYEKNSAGIIMLAESAQWPNKGTSKDQSHDVTLEVEGTNAALVLHNQTGRDVTANVKMLETAVTLMLASGVPRVSEIVYGDVYLVGDIERNRRMMAKYYVKHDTVFVLVVNRFADSFLQSLIHEFGHRYYKKVMDQESKREWGKRHLAMAREAPRVGIPAEGTVIQTDKGIRRVVSVGPFGRSGKMAIHLEDKGALWLDDYIRIENANAKKRMYPSAYSAKSDEEHFCEAFSFYCTGELAPQHREAFERIMGVQQRVPAAPPAPPPPPPDPERAPTRPVGKGQQIAMFNPSRVRSLSWRIRNP